MPLSNLPPDVTDSMIDSHANGTPGYCTYCEEPTEYTCSYCSTPTCENDTYHDKFCSPECYEDSRQQDNLEDYLGVPK